MTAIGKWWAPVKISIGMKDSYRTTHVFYFYPAELQIHMEKICRTHFRSILIHLSVLDILSELFFFSLDVPIKIEND
jgi:hypothetical protein